MRDNYCFKQCCGVILCVCVCVYLSEHRQLIFFTEELICVQLMYIKVSNATNSYWCEQSQVKSA